MYWHMHLNPNTNDMDYKSFEAQVGNTLRTAQEPLDTDLLIRAIQNDKREKSRPAVLWLLLSALVIATLSLTFYKMSDVNVLTNPSLENASPAAGLMAMPEANNNKTTLVASEEPSSLKKTKGSEHTFSGSSVTQKKYPKQKYQTASADMLASDVAQLASVETTASSDLQASATNDIHETRELISNMPKIASTESDIKLHIPALPSPKYGKVECPDFSNKSKAYLEIIPEVGAFLPLKTLEQTASEPSNVFALRKKDEHSLEGINVGLYARLRKTKMPFYLSAGLSWSRLTEKMNLNYSYTRMDTTQGIISITKSQNGDTITVIYGDIIREKKISGYKIRHHNFTLLDIPVALGYEKQRGDWSLGVEGGISFNLNMSSRGQILATDTSFVGTDVSPRPFRSNVGLSYFGGVLAGRRLGNGHRVYLAARFRYLPTVFSSDDSPVRQSYSFAGLNAGYIFTF